MDLYKAQNDKLKKYIRLLRNTYNRMKEDLDHYSKQKGILPPPQRPHSKPILKDKRLKSRAPQNANMTTPKKGQPRDVS
jgi:hypothetical protein